MAQTVTQLWPVGTDHKVVLSGLKDDAGNYINDATVTAVMKDSNGNVVSNGNTISFSLVNDPTNGPSATGDYQGIVPYNVDLLDGRTYTLEITAIKGARRVLVKMTRDAAYVTV